MQPKRPRSTTKQAPVIALSQYRAQIGRGRRRRRADVLFETPDPSAAIAALPGDEFYYVLQEIGFPEAMDIFVHGTAEQVQACLDFAVWDRDQLAPGRVETWLELLVAVPYETLGPWFRGLDVEFVARLLRARATIYDLSAGEPPDDPEGSFFSTPDGLFALNLHGTPDAQRLTSILVDALYRHDRDWMRRVLVGTMGDLDAELEETAFRWRAGRMADLGFEDYYDALEVYREIDPAQVQPGGPPIFRERAAATGRSGGEPFLRVPTALVERMSGGASPFAAAVAGVSSPAEVAHIHQSLVLLCNRVLSADRIVPGDEGAVTEVLARVAATLDLAVEFLARGDAANATLAVRTIPLVRIFRLGNTLIGKVKALARTLRTRNPFARLAPEIDLFESQDAGVIEAVDQLRPMFSCLLDGPDGTGTGTRPFASLADIARATAAVERAAATITLLVGLGLRPEHLESGELERIGVADPSALDAGVLARTLIVHRVLGHKAKRLEPLDAVAISSFKKKMKNKSQIHIMLSDIVMLLASRSAASAVMTRWTATLDPLETVLQATVDAG